MIYITMQTSDDRFKEFWISDSFKDMHKEIWDDMYSKLIFLSHAHQTQGT